MFCGSESNMTVLNLVLAVVAMQKADTVPPPVAAESPYTVHSAALELAGTLTMPRNAAGRVPVVVIIAGSGPTDRNGIRSWESAPTRTSRSRGGSQGAASLRS